MASEAVVVFCKGLKIKKLISILDIGYAQIDFILIKSRLSLS